MTSRLNRILLILPMALLLISCGDGDGSGSSGDGGGVIAFASFRDSRNQIYLMDADGNNQRNISNSNSLDDGPAWSPDGKRIAFVSEPVPGAVSPTPGSSSAGESAAIYVMNADGSGQENISNNFALNYDPAWSPAGTEIAFASRISNGEVWTGGSVAPGTINRLDLNGQPSGGLLSTGNPISVVLATGLEVWAGSSSTPGTVSRYQPDGVSLTPFDTGWPIGAMVLAREEVWIGSSATPGLIVRCDISPDSSGEIRCSPVGQSGSPIAAMVFDGNNIWAAGSSAPGAVTRFNLEGNSLAPLQAGWPVGAMVFAQNQVWIGSSVTPGQSLRCGVTENSSGQIDCNGVQQSGSPIEAMVFTGTEVWTGGGSGLGPVNRFNLLGAAIGSFDAGAPVLAIARSQEQIWIATNAEAARTVNRYRFSGESIGSLTLPVGASVGTLAFVPSENFSYRIVVMNSDGSNQRTLFSDPRFGGKPTWSPNGDQIAFYSFSDLLLPAGDLSQIWVMDSDGQNRVNISNNAVDNYDPAWSPDGNQIAFVLDEITAGKQQIYLMDADGSNPQNISNSSSDDSRPAWSPDGSQIVFSSFQDGNSQIYVMDSDGSSRQNISNNAFSNGDPAWRAEP